MAPIFITIPNLNISQLPLHSKQTKPHCTVSIQWWGRDQLQFPASASLERWRTEVSCDGGGGWDFLWGLRGRRRAKAHSWGKSQAPGFARRCLTSDSHLSYHPHKQEDENGKESTRSTQPNLLCDWASPFSLRITDCPSGWVEIHISKGSPTASNQGLTMENQSPRCSH